MKLEAKKYSRVIGVDVASRKLDVADSMEGLSKVIENDYETICQKLAAQVADTDTLVVCEGTGGYEDHLVDAMHEFGVDIAVVNPRQVRDFAKGHGLLEKTDKIDAAVIQKFGQDVRVHLRTPPTPQQKHHRAVHRRRSQLINLIQQEKNRLRQCRDPFVRQLTEKSICSINVELKLVDRKITELLKQQAQSDSRIVNWHSVPGVGIMTVSAMVCEVPEIGLLSRGAIAKLIGVAPLANQSGATDKKRKPRGGRGSVRCILYMAALSATQHNPVLKSFYQRLLKRGKPKKTALLAVARKLLVILNDMARHDKAWDPQAPSKKATASETQLPRARHIEDVPATDCNIHQIKQVAGM